MFISSFQKVVAAALTLSALFVVQSAFAQGGGGPIIPVDVPIDGGVSLLAVAGGAYAMRKLRNRKGKA